MMKSCFSFIQNDNIDDDDDDDTVYRRNSFYFQSNNNDNNEYEDRKKIFDEKKTKKKMYNNNIIYHMSSSWFLLLWLLMMMKNGLKTLNIQSSSSSSSSSINLILIFIIMQSIILSSTSLFKCHFYCDAFSIQQQSKTMNKLSILNNNNTLPSSSSSSISYNNDNQSTIIEQLLLFRHKRDEEPAPIYGKGIAFWLGEHCENTCNRILFHVWCNSTTHRCECLQEYPVNVENKYCLKALQINDRCEYSEACRYLNPNSECNEQGFCKCLKGYFVKYDDEKESRICMAYDSQFFIRIGSTTFDFINKIEFITLFSLIISFILILILSMMVIKLMKKNKKLAKNDQPSFCDMIPPPPPVIMNAQPDRYNNQHSHHHHHHHHHPFHHHQTSSLQSTPSRSPFHQDYSLQEKTPISSYNIPPLPSNLNDFRRQSLSSLRSQSSLKSLSSFRSQHSYRVNNNNNNNNHSNQHQQHPMSSYHRTIHCQQQSKLRPPSHQTSYHDLRYTRQPLMASGSSPLDSQTDQSGFQLSNHLPTNPITSTNTIDRSRIKCANHRCGTGSKVRSEVCLVHNMPEMLQQQQQQN
ncbi:uncharacterized protein LOC124491218 isoform X2 [Dermatophagoides farinae]|uniref:uncharacterized protein LOC124491218 isoform X2 n=1 Tax=Dermatophagoides farinae TaxID=6954 RepID=UPI003F5DFC21